ncbi:MAG: tetratricopeptide repeat protein, partial [Gemmataceae bacterium]
MPLSRGLAWAVLLCGVGPLGAQTPAERQQAEVALNAARKAHTEGNLPAARDLYKQFLAKHANMPGASAARYGLGVCALAAAEPDYAGAIEPLQQAANDGNFPERPAAMLQLAQAFRGLMLKETNAEGQRRRADEMIRWLHEAANQFQGKKDWDSVSRCHADRAEAYLRSGRIKDARSQSEMFTKDENLAKAKYRPLGLYYHGLACFLDRDYAAAGKVLNQLAPFADPGFGPHARYLVGRVLHLNGETAEAAIYYDGALADYATQKQAAIEALKQPERFKNEPEEKRRLEALVKSAPEYVAGALFHTASLGYEASKFADALAKFQEFEKTFAESPWSADAKLRIALCQVQLKQPEEALKTLAGLAEKTPRLADQADAWMGRALWLQAQGLSGAEAEAKAKAAGEFFRKSAERAQQLLSTDPEARGRRAEVQLDQADVLLATKQPGPAAQLIEQIWQENAIGERRRPEVLQRLAQANGEKGDHGRSDHFCDEFQKLFPQNALVAAVVFRRAENAYLRVSPAKNPNERRERLQESIKRYQEVVDRFPEYERLSYARYGLGLCYAQLGELENAAKALDAIPAPDRGGELAPAAYLLADCLIRLAPLKAEDALAENKMREKLTAASGLLENYVASNPKAADAPEALLKLGLCLKRLGASLADANERNQLLNKSREFFEKLNKDYGTSLVAPHARLEAAKIKALLGDRGGAMNDLRQFASADDKNPVAALALLHLATLHREQNEFPQAGQVLADARTKHEAALRADPARADWADLLKYHHGVALLEAKKPAEGQKLLEEVSTSAKG